MPKRSAPNTPKTLIDLSILRLAAMAIDIRGRLSPHELQKAPSLEAALAALDAVLDEMGWDETKGPPKARRSHGMKGG